MMVIGGRIPPFVESEQGTGGDLGQGDYKIIICSIDKYLIEIKLTPDDKFIEIASIKINKDFLSFKQKGEISDFHDVEKFYPD